MSSVPVKNYVTPTEFLEYVASRGYKVEPILNTGETGYDGLPLPIRVTGYMLVGPRRNKKVVGKMPNGRLPLFDAELWADAVDYATAKINAKKAA